jgi:hypothetical protein
MLCEFPLIRVCYFHTKHYYYYYYYYYAILWRRLWEYSNNKTVIKGIRICSSHDGVLYYSLCYDSLFVFFSVLIYTLLLFSFHHHSIHDTKCFSLHSVLTEERGQCQALVKTRANENCCLLCCDTVWSGRKARMSQGRLLRVNSGYRKPGDIRFFRNIDIFPADHRPPDPRRRES